MPHWRLMMSGEYLYAADLMGREFDLKIVKITQGELPDFDGGKRKMPFVWFEGAKKPLGLNSTNARQIAKLHGTNIVEEWIGKWITLVPTTTKVGREEHECIRVKNRIPKPPAAGKGAQGFPRPPDDVAASTPMTDEERAEIEAMEREVNQ